MSKISLNSVGDLTNITTAETTINTNFSTVQTAFDNTLSRDGTSPNQMSSNLDMNSFRILNLPTPINSYEPLRVIDGAIIQGGGNIVIAPVGAGTNISLSGTSPVNVNTIPNPNFATSVTTPSLILNGTTINSVTGTGSLVMSNGAVLSSPSLVTPGFATIINTGTLTLPTSTDTLVARNTTDTLTNKTLTSPTLTTPTLGAATATTINKVTITQPATAATLTIINNKTLTANNTLTLAGTDSTTITFQGTDTYVGRTTTDTLTNKTLTTPIIAQISNTGTLTLPTSTDTLIGKATTDTLTNKTFDTAGAGNVFKVNGTTISSTSGSGSSIPLLTNPAFTTSIGVNGANGHVSITDTGTSFAYTDIVGGGLTGLRFGQEGSSGGSNLVVGSAAGDGCVTVRDNKRLIFGANNSAAVYINPSTGIGVNSATDPGAGGYIGTGNMLIKSATAIPAGGTAGAGYMFSSTSNYGVFFGSGAPSLSAAKGSLYLRSDGTTTNDRAYINTNGSTTWTSLTTAA